MFGTYNIKRVKKDSVCERCKKAFEAEDGIKITLWNPVKGTTKMKLCIDCFVLVFEGD